MQGSGLLLMNILKHISMLNNVTQLDSIVSPPPLTMLTESPCIMIRNFYHFLV